MSPKEILPTPPPASILYEDEWLYVCLALFPFTKGHTVVVWKGEVPDLRELSDSEYDYLMQVMDIARDTLLEVLGVKMVYLIYMDEVKQVHWQLVPRYNAKGFDIFVHEPPQTDDFSLAPALRAAFEERQRTRIVRTP